MLFSLLVSYKETLEASLIIGSIVLYLMKYGKNFKIVYLYLGAVLGFVFSMFLVFFGFKTIQSFTSSIKNVVQGIVLFFISFVIVSFVILINRGDNPASKYLSKNLHYIEKSTGLFWVAFFIEIKEGIELTLLNIGNLDNSAAAVLSSTIIGMVLAIISVYLLLIRASKLNTHIALRAVSIFFIIAAGLMLGHSIFLIIPVETSALKILANFMFTSIFLLVYLKTSFSFQKS